MNKYLKIFIWITLLSAISLIGLIVYWLVYPYKTIESPSKYQILTPTIKVGDNLVYRAYYCKYTNMVPTDVKRQLVDGLIYDLPVSTANNFAKGCRTVDVSVPMVVPMSLIDYNQRYYLRITVTYKPNPLRTITVISETEGFTITK